MTYLWQEERGKKFYKFQTDEKEIYNKLIRRQGFKLSARGFNCDLWTFNAEFSRPDIARKMLKSLTGNSVKFDKKEDIYFSECQSMGLRGRVA